MECNESCNYMLDTIVLMIPQENFNVLRYDYFSPPIGGMFREPFIPFAGQPFVKCVQNMTKEDIKNNVYKPRLTVFKRKTGKHNVFKLTLYIELSIPKLLHGNNFDEVKEADFDDVIKALMGKLFQMGIHITKENLMEAKIKTIHYSKNIVFDDCTSASSIISLLGKIKLTQRLDLNQTDYWNNGHLVRYHAKSYSLVFYDKVADLIKSPARAVEKQDRTFNYQMDIFDAVRQQTPLEVLRMEFRMNERQKIEKFLKMLGFEIPITFKYLFNEEVAKAVLLHYWDFIHKELMPILLQNITPYEQFELIAKQRQELTPQRILAMVAVSSMIKDKGHRTVQGGFKRLFSTATLDRVYKDIRKLDYKILNRSQPIEHVHQALKEFKPLKLKDYDPAYFM